LKVPEGGVGAGARADSGQDAGANGLASKLLGSNDSNAGGTVESRETTTLKGVY